MIKTVRFLIVLLLLVQVSLAQDPELVVQTGHSEELTNLGISGDGKWLVSGSDDGSAKLWDVSTQRELRSFTGKFPDGGLRVAISPDGKMIAAVNDIVTIWKTDTGEEVASFSHSSTKKLKDEFHTYTSNSLADVTFSPDGRLIAAAAHDGDVIIWDVAKREAVQKLVGTNKWLGDPVFSGDGRLFAATSGDREVIVWDVGSGRRLYTLRGQPNSVFAVAFNKDSNLLAMNDGRTAKVWSLSDGKLLRTLTGHNHIIGALQFLPSTDTLVTSDEGGVFNFWNANSGELIRSISGAANIASFVVSPDEKSIISNSFEQVQISYIELDSGKRIPSMEFLLGAAFVQFSPDSESLLIRNAFETVLLNKSNSNPSHLESMHGGYFWPTAFSPDGRKVAVAGGKAATVWSIGSEQAPQKLVEESDAVNVFFNADATKLVVVTGSGNAEHTYTVWDVASGVKMRSTADLDKISEIAGDFHIPDLGSRKSLNSSKTIRAEIGDVGEVVLFENATDKVLCRIFTFWNRNWLVTTPSGWFDGTANAWSQIAWRFENNTFNSASVEAFFKEFYRPGLLQEVLAGRSIEQPKTELASVDIRQPTVAISAFDSENAPQAPRREPALSTTTVTRREVLVEVEVTDADETRRRLEHPPTAGARDLRLFRNGSLVRKWSGDIFDKANGCDQIAVKPGEPRKAVCKVKVTITAGDNKLTAYAFNTQNVKSRDATAAVKGADSLRKPGTLYVLAVGVDKYADSSRDLKYAVADARAIGASIANEQNTLKKFARTEIITLADKDATRANILLALKRFSSGADLSNLSEPLRSELGKINVTGPEDTIVFHFSGHGTARCQADEKGVRNCDRFYLLPRDGFPTELSMNAPNYSDTMFKASISDEDLEFSFAPIDAGNLLMIIDACNSGQALEAEEKRRGPMNSRGLAQLAYEKGMLILTASQSQQAALETNKLGHGLLTYSLIDGMKRATKTADNLIIDRNWFNFAAVEVPKLQMEEMQKRDAEVKNGTRDIGIHYANGEEANLPPEKRALQSPRLFYRREADATPFIVARP